MPRPMRLLAAAAGAVLALVPASAAPADQTSSLRTREVGCYEFNEIARVPVAGLQGAVPPVYTVRPGALDRTVGFIVFVDYACDAVTVNGFTWPNRTVVTMGVAALSARNGIPGSSYYVLWHATNNPHLANALRKLGVPSHTILARDDIVPVDDTHSRIRMRYHGAGLDYHRDALVVEPPAGPIRQSASAQFYHLGDRGEVLLAYANRLRPTSTARTELTVDDDSYLAALGVPLTVVSNIAFTRGDWNGTATLQ